MNNVLFNFHIEVYTFRKTKILHRLKIVKGILCGIEYKDWTHFIRLRNGKIITAKSEDIYLENQLPQLKERIKKMRIEGYEDYCR